MGMKHRLSETTNTASIHTRLTVAREGGNEGGRQGERNGAAGQTDGRYLRAEYEDRALETARTMSLIICSDDDDNGAKKEELYEHLKKCGGRFEEVPKHLHLKTLEIEEGKELTSLLTWVFFRMWEASAQEKVWMYASSLTLGLCPRYDNEMRLKVINLISANT